VNNIDSRLTKLEQAARSIKRPLGPLVLIEGQDGSRQEILDRLEEAIREGNKGPLIIFAADDRPTSSLPSSDTQGLPQRPDS
jgi:hypothetical protein